MAEREKYTVRPLPRSFYQRDPKVVAKSLLGKILVHRTEQGVTKGKIVETEAYYGENDPASHAYGGRRTPRNEAMWGEAGTAYVYFTYGKHHMLNVVTGKKGKPRAVLVRAVEALEGIGLMRERRGRDETENLTSGPGNLTQAFGITLKENKADLVEGNLRIEEGEKEHFDVVATGRVGLSAGGDRKLRFYVKNSRFVSQQHLEAI